MLDVVGFQLGMRFHICPRNAKFSHKLRAGGAVSNKYALALLHLALALIPHEIRWGEALNGDISHGSGAADALIPFHQPRGCTVNVGVSLVAVIQPLEGEIVAESKAKALDGAGIAHALLIPHTRSHLRRGDLRRYLGFNQLVGDVPHHCCGIGAVVDLVVTLILGGISLKALVIVSVCIFELLIDVLQAR